MNVNIMNKFFPKQMERIEDCRCPICNEEINFMHFRNKISLKEFSISKMCQKCQDKFFGKD